MLVLSFLCKFRNIYGGIQHTLCGEKSRYNWASTPSTLANMLIATKVECWIFNAKNTRKIVCKWCHYSSYSLSKSNALLSLLAVVAWTSGNLVIYHFTQLTPPLPFQLHTSYNFSITFHWNLNTNNCMQITPKSNPISSNYCYRCLYSAEFDSKNDFQSVFQKTRQGSRFWWRHIAKSSWNDRNWCEARIWKKMWIVPGSLGAFPCPPPQQPR